MLGLLRTASAVAQRSATARTTARSAPAREVRSACIPFVPVDWLFRFFPYFCRDRVRFMLRFNQICFGCGLGYFYLWCHAPYKFDHYDGFYESPLYLYVKGGLARSGQLEENLRVKVKHFYPTDE